MPQKHDLWMVCGVADDGDSFVRVVCADDILSTLDSALVDHRRRVALQDQLAVRTSDVECDAEKEAVSAADNLAHSSSADGLARLFVQPFCFDKAPSAKSVYITNIAGKITHALTDGKYVIRPEVMPCVKRVVNGFGVFLCLFSVDGNIYTTQCNRYSFFRGGTDFGRMQVLFRHAFGFESIVSVELHVVVLSCNIGRPVRVTNQRLHGVMVALQVWTVSSPVLDEHAQSVSFQLTAADNGNDGTCGSTCREARIQRLFTLFGMDDSAALANRGLACTRHLLLTVSHTGAVNLFVSIDTGHSAEMLEWFQPAYIALTRLVEQVLIRVT